MASNITVTTQTLRDKAGELRTTNGKFKTQVENLRSEEQALSFMWEGDANDAFHAAFTNDAVQMDNFYDAIENYCVALEQIAQQYDATESQNQSIASSRKYK